MIYRYVVQSVDRKDNILLLTLTPKRTGRMLSFTPGQYATVGFRRGIRPTPMRCFSMISTPTSSTLQFAMRVEGSFTQGIANLRPGNAVKVQGAFGNFTINPDYDHHIVMLASGIGITPFLSMLRDTTDRHVKIPIVLFYSNKSSTDIPFKTQLLHLAAQNPSLDIQFFSGDTTGRITKEHLRTLVSSTKEHTTYFICGTSNFTQRTQALLTALGVHDSRILNESFTQTVPATTNSGLSLRALTYSLSATILAVVTAGIMLLDLSRNLPRPQAETTTTTQTTNTSSNDSNTTTSDSTNTPTQSPAASQNGARSSDQTNYQTPVSSVS